VIEKGLPNQVEVEKFDACTKELLDAIDAWQTVKKDRKDTVVSDRATTVAELRRQVSSCQDQWKFFAAMKMA